MNVNEAIEKLTELQKLGYGELEIESDTIEIDGVDAVCIPQNFIKPIKNFDNVVTMILEEKFIY